MEYFYFLEQLVDEGISAARSDYTSPSHKNELEGSIAGFNVCRGKKPHELIEIYKECQLYVTQAFNYKDTQEYWWLRCYQMEIEFVLNVVSAALVNEGGDPLLSHLPTYIGVMKAAKILGVSNG